VWRYDTQGSTNMAGLFQKKFKIITEIYYVLAIRNMFQYKFNTHMDGLWRKRNLIPARVKISLSCEVPRLTLRPT